MKEFHKYPKIKIIGNADNLDLLINSNDEIVVEEKVDGSNFRFMYYDGKFIFGSRNRELGEPKEDNKAWGKCIGYIKRLMKKGDYNNFIFYGECMTRHSTPYDYNATPPFIGFDIYDLKRNIFLDWETARRFYEDIDLHFVPVIDVLKAKDVIPYEDINVPKSKYYNGQAEGVVLKNYSTQVFAKYVTAKHREECTRVFGGSKKWATNDTDKIIATYCTNPRIEKKIFELIHDGNNLDLPMMKHLPMMVFNDIVEEHYKDILSKNLKIDVGRMRKTIAKRCLGVLKMMIVNSAFEDDTK